MKKVYYNYMGTQSRQCINTLYVSENVKCLNVSPNLILYSCNLFLILAFE